MDASIASTAKEYGRSYNTHFDRQLQSYKKQPQQTEPFVQKDRQVISRSFAGIALKITGFMAIIAIFLFFAANWYGDQVSKGGHTTDTSLRKIVIGNDYVSVPANMIRFSSQRRASSVNRLDLYAHWPSLAGYSDALADDFNSMSDSSPLVFVSLEPRSMSKDMSGRVESIYEHFFGGPPIDAGYGLVRRAFSSDSAYFSEDLYYEADSPYPYAARCIRESDKIAAPFCIRDIHVGKNLTLTYRFHTNLLPQWMIVDRAIRTQFSKMIGPAQ